MSAAGFMLVSMYPRCSGTVAASGLGSPVAGSRGIAEEYQSVAVKFVTFWSRGPTLRMVDRTAQLEAIGGGVAKK